MDARWGVDQVGAKPASPRARRQGGRCLGWALDLEDAEIDDVIRAVCTRDLEATAYPYLHIGVEYLDPLKGEVRHVVTATGARNDAGFEPVGIAVGDTDDPVFWRRFLCDLLVRGLHGVRVLASSGHPALQDAATRVLPRARWQLAGSLDSVALEDVLVAVWAADECEWAVGHRSRATRPSPATAGDGAPGAIPIGWDAEAQFWPPDGDVPWLPGRIRRVGQELRAERSKSGEPVDGSRGG